MNKLPASVLGCLLLAATCAGLRQMEITRVVPAAELRFDPAHSLSWDPGSRQLGSTGDDPYGFIVLPPASRPLHEVIIDFSGVPPATRSNFYIYQYPANLPGVFLNDSYALTGKPETVGDGFRIRWVLDDSKVARLDLPDDLTTKVEVRQVSFVSGRFGPWAGNLMWLALAAGLITPLWLGLRPWFTRHAAVEWGVFALLVALKLTFASDLRLTVIGNAAHDDALFVGQADAIMQGHWLGAFNERTLAKGPVYPLFLAAVGLAHAHLQTVQLVLHALLCVVFVAACRPLLPMAGARLLLLIVLLYDPHSYSSETIGRVLRSGIQPALTLGVLAGLIGLGARITGPARRLAPWSLLLGFAWTGFWFCREEGLWLIPSAALIFGVVLWQAFRLRDPSRRTRLALLGLPFLVFAAGDLSLRLVNRHYYGEAMTVDVSDGPFPKAYGALVRLTPRRESPGVPVPHEVQLRAYEVSPAFAELRPFLEGDVGASWVHLSVVANGERAAPDEIGGGWYQWALREAAARAGHYRNAATAAAYWRRVADELNAAADQGRIAAGPRRSGFLPRVDASVLPALRDSFHEAFHVVVEFAHFTTQYLAVDNSAEQVAQFDRVTHELHQVGWAKPTRITGVRIALSQVYGALSRTATGVGLAATALLAVLALRRRRGALQVAVVLALLGGATALMLVISLVDATSFTATIGTYLAPATPLVLAWWVLAPAWAAGIWRREAAV